MNNHNHSYNTYLSIVTQTERGAGGEYSGLKSLASDLECLFRSSRTHIHLQHCRETCTMLTFFKTAAKHITIPQAFLSNLTPHAAGLLFRESCFLFFAVGHFYVLFNF